MFTEPGVGFLVELDIRPLKAMSIGGEIQEGRAMFLIIEHDALETACFVGRIGVAMVNALAIAIEHE